jgi:hypothetical protein
MSRMLMTVAFVGLLSGSAIQAAVLDISIAAQGAGYNSMVADAKLRGDGGLQDANLGAVSGDSDRFYANYLLDGVTPTSGRQNSFVQRFDVSSIPVGAYITSAILTENFANRTVNTRTWFNVKLSRLQPGKDWTEGVNQSPATDGSVTWNSQKGNTVPWATPGATSGSDIDLGTTQTFDIVGVDGQGTTINRDVTAWVQDWVNAPVNNTGMVWWGGNNNDSGSQNRAFWFGVKEDGAGAPGENFAGAPSLLIEYTVPEPSAAVFLFGGGLLMWIARRRKVT